MLKLKSEWMDEILPHWNDANFKSSPHVLSLVQNGIPPKMRAVVWKLSIPNRLNITKQYYAYFREQASEAKRKIQKYQKSLLDINSQNQMSANSAVQQQQQSDKRICEKLNRIIHLKVIEQDLPRTFSCLSIFQANSPLSESLSHVLYAIALSRPDVQYV